MIFGPKNKKENVRPLSEDEVKSRLYGSAVGYVSTARETPSEKKHKPHKEKPSSLDTASGGEQLKIKKEIQDLKKELEQTRKKLERMRGVRTKKIRLLIIAAVIISIIAVVTVFALRGLLSRSRDSGSRSLPPTVISEEALYAIQAAVYGDEQDAKRFASELRAKGYNTFIRESRYQSGKPKFIIYVGGFKDKDSASKVLDKLKTEGGIKDSFITSMPK
jgi:hypothetical protein